MAVFSTNQNRHLYVATAFNSTSGGGRKELDDNSFSAGAIDVKTVGDGTQKELFFLYKNPDGEVIKSDRIQLRNLDYVKGFDSFSMLTPLKKVEVTLDSTINSGAPISGQDYVLRINLRQFYGMSDEDQYFKDAVVHATSGMSASDFYKAMVNSLNLSFSREVGATKTSNPYLSFAVDDTTTATKIVITEKIQSWTLGVESQERVLFDVVPTTVYTSGNDVIWGKAEDKTPAKMVEDTDSESATYGQMIPNSALVAGSTAIGNGKKIADLEWFCMGERGDQYRMIGYPNYVPTKYMVNADNEYHVLEIHHAFTDTGVNSYRSEKDITIVSSTKSVINAIIGAINTAASLNIATI